MTPQTEPLFRYDPFSPEAMRDPQYFYPILRERHPAYFIPEYDAWVFSRYADVWDAFMDAKSFSEAEGQLFARSTLLAHHRGNPPPPRIDPEKAMFLWLDPPVHTHFRQALAAPYMKANVAKLAPAITSLARDQLKQVLPRGQFDLNTDFASHVSVGAVALIMGLPISDAGHVIGLVNAMVARAPDTPGMTEDGSRAHAELLALLRIEVARRRAGKGPDSAAIDPLLRKDLIGRPLSDEEIAVDMLAILVGGTETTPKVFAGGLLTLSRQPEQLAAVAADPAANAIPAFEEMLRYCAPAQWFGRTVKTGRELGGVTLEPGQRVILLIAAANRDPREFENPEAFIWNRKARRMLSFGVGPHFCIGIHLARLEGQIMLREFLSAVRAFEIAPELGEWARSEFQIGWTRLPVRLA